MRKAMPDAMPDALRDGNYRNAPEMPRTNERTQRTNGRTTHLPETSSSSVSRTTKADDLFPMDELSLFIESRERGGRPRLEIPAGERRRRRYELETDLLRRFIRGAWSPAQERTRQVGRSPRFEPTPRQLEIAIAALEAIEAREAAQAAKRGHAA